jgi:hypothetical protein
MTPTAAAVAAVDDHDQTRQNEIVKHVKVMRIPSFKKASTYLPKSTSLGAQNLKLAAFFVPLCLCVS